MNLRSEQPVSARSLLPVLIVAGFLCRAAFAWFTPEFYAPDEQSHYNYVRYLSEHQAFPVLNSKLGEASNEWEYFQPPFYYLLLAPLFTVARTFGGQPAQILLLLRAFSILLWLLNLLLGHLLLQRLQVKDDVLRVMVFGLVCLLPTYTFSSAAVNNDNLLAIFGTITLCLMAKPQRSWKTFLTLGLVLGLALLTKQSAVIFFPAVALLVVWEAASRRLAWGPAFGHLALALGLATAMYLPWALRNVHLYGTLTPETLSANRVSWPSVLYGLASAVHNLVKTFWSVSGISNNVGYPFPLLGLGALACWWIGWRTPGAQAKPLPLTSNPAWSAAMFTALGVNLLLVLRFGYLLGMGQGRHLFPLLYGIALVLATGWRKLPIRSLALTVSLFWIGYAGSFMLFSLTRFPR